MINADLSNVFTFPNDSEIDFVMLSDDFNNTKGLFLENLTPDSFSNLIEDFF